MSAGSVVARLDHKRRQIEERIKNLKVEVGEAYATLDTLEEELFTINKHIQEAEDERDST